MPSIKQVHRLDKAVLIPNLATRKFDRTCLSARVSVARDTAVPPNSSCLGQSPLNRSKCQRVATQLRPCTESAETWLFPSFPETAGACPQQEYQAKSQWNE